MVRNIFRHHFPALSPHAPDTHHFSSFILHTIVLVPETGIARMEYFLHFTEGVCAFPYFRVCKSDDKALY
jgi:hypothetical protein